jgi:hypothetical protein
MIRIIGSLFAAVLVVQPAVARAQAVPFGRIEVSGGLIYVGGTGFGTADAALTTPAGTTTPLFRTTTTLDGAPGASLRFGVRITRRVEAEAFASITRPTLSTTITNDVESCGTVTADERLKQYIFGAGALWYMSRFATAKFRPFLSGGVAYLRELHEANTLAVNGRVYEGGAGAKYFFRSRRVGGVNGYGLRGDVKVAARAKGVAFDDDLHYGPALTASFFARF